MIVINGVAMIRAVQSIPILSYIATKDNARLSGYSELHNVHSPTTLIYWDRCNELGWFKVSTIYSNCVWYHPNVCRLANTIVKALRRWYRSN